MTALERALVVYAEAKGYEIEVTGIGTYEWSLKGLQGFFKFDTCNYRLRDPRNMHKVCNSLYAEYLPNIPEKSISEMVENIKKFKPAGFSCKTKMYTREEIEEMNKPKEEEFDVKAYVKSLVQTPEYLERCKEVDPIIEILEAYKNGETIERKEKYSSYEWSKLWKGHVWNFSDFDYRISPKQPEAIPATEEELEIIGKGVLWCRNKKDPNRMGWIRHNDKLNNSEWYIFDPVSKTWQDWGSK